MAGGSGTVVDFTSLAQAELDANYCVPTAELHFPSHAQTSPLSGQAGPKVYSADSSTCLHSFSPSSPFLTNRNDTNSTAITNNKDNSNNHNNNNNNTSNTIFPSSSQQHLFF